MAKRTRPSPTEKDIRRWAEAISEPDIENIDDFETAWNEYFEDDEEMLGRSDLRAATFNELRTFRTDIKGVKRPRRLREVVKFRRKQKVIKVRREYPLRARSKQRLVKAEKTFVTVKGKKMLRYRDRLGRFVRKI